MMFHQFSIKNCGVPIKSSIYPYMHVFSMNFDFACPIFSWCFHMFIKKMVLDHLPFSIHVPMFILFTNENWWISQREIQARFASLRRQLAAAWFTTQGGLSQGLAHHRYSMGKTTIFRWNIWEKGWKMHGTWKISWEIPLCLIGKEIWKNGCKVKCRWKCQGFDKNRQWKLHPAFFVPTIVWENQYHILVNGEFERILPTKPGS